jgi:hypothetical protein
MEFNFSTFFGYENDINNLKDLVLIYGFATIIFSIVGLIFIGAIVRKLGFATVISYFISPLMLSLGLTLVVSILPTIIFYVVTSDVSGVKIIYSWITIFTGMLLFTMFNLNTIKKFVKEFGKMTEQEEFRNRNR